MITYIDNKNYKNYTKFTQENNLELDDDIILVQDIPASDMVKMDRLDILSKKTFTTADEKAEMTQLQADLIDYMPTADKINKLNGMVYGMQVYLKEGVVIFINQQKQELIDIVNNHKYMGIYVPLTTYSQGNMVMYNGYGFISKINGNIGHTPDKEAIDDGYWIRFTIKGDKGDPSLNISIKTNTTGGADYDALTTYNVGDACVYNHRLYYCLADGTIGIMVTDSTKWACADKIWIGTDEPLDHFVIWWDTNSGQDVLKRYSANNEWVDQKVKASDMIITDTANYFTSVNVEGALAELKVAINNIDLTASKVKVVDNSNLYTGTNAETCLAEVMTKANSATSLANTAQARADSAFTFANNGKTSVASVVGNLTSSNTFAQITSEIQTDKNTLATNLINKGVTASNGDTLRNLASLVGNVGNLQIRTGTATNTGEGYVTFDVSNLGFEPLLFTIYQSYPNQFHDYSTYGVFMNPNKISTGFFNGKHGLVGFYENDTYYYNQWIVTYGYSNGSSNVYINSNGFGIFNTKFNGLASTSINWCVFGM